MSAGNKYVVGPILGNGKISPEAESTAEEAGNGAEKENNATRIGENGMRKVGSSPKDGIASRGARRREEGTKGSSTFASEFGSRLIT